MHFRQLGFNQIRDIGFGIHRLLHKFPLNINYLTILILNLFSAFFDVLFDLPGCYFLQKLLG
jgi:hypothetical protein